MKQRRRLTRCIEVALLVLDVSADSADAQEGAVKRLMSAGGLCLE